MAEEQAETNYKPYFRIYAVWHPACGEGQELVDHLFRRLFSNPDNPLGREGLGIPVHFRSAPDGTGKGAPPRPIDYGASHHSATFVFIDDKMVIGDGWPEYVESLDDSANAAEGAHRLIPVALSGNAFGISDTIAAANFIRHFEDVHKADTAVDRLTRRVLHSCSLQLKDIGSDSQGDSAPSPVRLFLSHAKKDGVEITKSINDWIHEDELLNTFFDRKDIAAGYDFGNEIKRGVETAALLIVLTDAYSSRPWCLEELHVAKENRIPILVVFALEHGERRSPAYGGNLPTVVWKGVESIPEVVERLLLEDLRFRYFPRHAENLKTLSRFPGGATILPNPPEFLDLDIGKAAGADEVVYPDPPLSNTEMSRLQKSNPGVQFFTPSFASAGRGEDKPLTGKVIAISISDSPDLAQLGFQPLHLQHCMTEIARDLLALGATVAYGGDLRPGGFTLDLIDLVRAYGSESGETPEKIRNYVAWPISLLAGDSWRAENFKTVKIVNVEAPSDVVDAFDLKLDEFLPPTTPQNQYIWVRCLTAMREQMTRDIDARIVLGGQTGKLQIIPGEKPGEEKRVGNYKGRMPGIAEEALMVLREKKPLYVLGGFGGIATALGEALGGQGPDELTETWQVGNNRDPDSGFEYGDVLKFLNDRVAAGDDVEPVDYKEMTAALNDAGKSGCNNGLTGDEWDQLFASDDPEQQVHLILRGLSKALGGSA